MPDDRSGGRLVMINAGDEWGIGRSKLDKLINLVANCNLQI